MLSFSLDSTNKNVQRSESVLPIEEEVNRMYRWNSQQLSLISLYVSADILDLGTLEVLLSW